MSICSERSYSLGVLFLRFYVFPEFSALPGFLAFLEYAVNMFPVGFAKGVSGFVLQLLEEGLVLRASCFSFLIDPPLLTTEFLNFWRKPGYVISGAAELGWN